MRVDTRAAFLSALALCTTAGLAVPDSTTITSALGGGSSLLADITGDCMVTDTDVAVRVLIRLESMIIGDLDGDGVVTANDRILAIKDVILTSYGDVNRDLDVDARDLSQALIDAGTISTLDSDANTDGRSDADDVLYIIDALGRPTLWGVELIAADLFRVVAQIEAEGGADVFVNSQGCVAGEPEIRPHRRSISESWYVPGSDHRRSHSALWPQNHLISVSLSWDDVDHAVATSSQENWPANHKGNYSCTWKDPGDTGADGGCFDAEHETRTSWSHPGDHDVAKSDRWKRAPGHLYSRSQTWPDDPSRHDSETSWSWPGNHFFQTSVDGHLSGHHENYSSFDWPGNHGVTRSQVWPPSHTFSVSTNWAPGHAGSWSFRWPQNHAAAVSATWDPTTYPTKWPPNHVAAVSEGENLPGPWEETWPRGHTRWTSTRDILQIPSDLMPDLWWPL
jgi:hypothetical protein